MKSNKFSYYLNKLILGIFILQNKSGFQVRKFITGLDGARSVVVLLPNDEVICKSAVPLVSSLLVKKTTVTLIVHSCCRVHFAGLHNVQFLEYFPSDINKLQYPKRSFREKMHFTEADALVACNFSDDIFLHICALLLKCRVKIGIKGNLTDWIYQIQFVPTGNSLANSVKQLQDYCHLS